jgi:hypothetical protein
LQAIKTFRCKTKTKVRIENRIIAVWRVTSTILDESPVWLAFPKGNDQSGLQTLETQKALSSALVLKR